MIAGLRLQPPPLRLLLLHDCVHFSATLPHLIKTLLPAMWFVIPPQTDIFDYLFDLIMTTTKVFSVSFIGLNCFSYWDHFAFQYNGQMKAANGASSSSSSTSGYDQEDYNHHHQQQQPSLACLNQNLQPIPQLKANPASQINDDKLIELMERTGYNIVQKNGQRIFGGPPPGWTGVPPCKGTEIFVGKVPRNMFEWELVPIFEKVTMIINWNFYWITK